MLVFVVVVLFITNILHSISLSIDNDTRDIATSYLGKTIGFLTGGNDGKMIVCDNEGNKLLSCETPPNVDIKSIEHDL